MNEAAMFARVQQCLDARCDPLDDDEVVAFLDAHPEALTIVATMRAQAIALATPGPVRAPRRRRVLRTAAAFFAAAGVLAIIFVAIAPRAERCPAGRILTASLTETRPRAYAAATYLVHEPLVQTPTTTLERWQLHSEPR